MKEIITIEILAITLGVIVIFTGAIIHSLICKNNKDMKTLKYLKEKEKWI